jgi:hypothetical protein
MSRTLPTTNPEIVTVSGLGTASPLKKGFQQTAVNVPSPDEVWKNFFGNVMRGSVDGPWYGDGFSEELGDSVSRTFSDPSASGETPPEIKNDNIEGLGNPGTLGAGAPDGGFVPTVASPGAGNSDNPNMIPALNGRLVAKLLDAGAGNNSNGSILSPAAGSTSQTSQDSAQTGESPFYSIGTYAWSDLVSPRPV